MPKIAVYKHQDKIIPVSDAKVSKAYQCPFTQRLFTSKVRYTKHLKVLRKDRMWHNARHNRWQRKMTELWNQPSFEKIVEWIESNPEVFWFNGKQRGWSGDAKQWDKIRDDFRIKITHLDLHYSNCVSNSHSAPHTGVTNWGGRKEDAPCGYPGWSGRIEFQISHDVPSFTSNLFDKTRIHTGTGGASNNHYRFGVSFFQDDWPGVSDTLEKERKQYEKNLLIDMIKNDFELFAVPRVTIGKPRR